jgi:hypothetical protein
LTSPEEWTERFRASAQACLAALEAGSLRRVREKLSGADGLRRAFDLLGRATALRHPQPALLDAFRAELGSPAPPEPDLAHALLLAASLHAIPQVPVLPVGDLVKKLFLDEFGFYAAPPDEWRARCRFSDVRFQEMGRIATLQRFPAGQYHWEMAAFPRSWLPKVARQWRAWTRAFVPMRGFGPLFELHLNDRRKNRILLLESETNLSCYRAAQSLELQPGVKGIMTMSWLYCASTAAATPHLAWMRRLFLDAGAAIVDLGEAPPDSGFLVGSAERRKLYEQGRYRPRTSCVLWPRARVLEWAKQHPEFNRQI